MFEILFFVFIMAIITSALAFTPYLTRKSEIFGISIPSSETNRPEFKQLRSGYRNAMLLCGAIFTAILIALYYMLNQNMLPYVFVPVIFLYILLAFLFYLPRHKAARNIKEQYNWNIHPATLVVDTQPSAKDKPSSAWLLLFVIFILASVILTIVYYPAMPDRIPMHYDFQGNITNYGNKSLSLAFFMPGMQVFLAAVFSIVFLITRRAKRQIDAADPENSRLQGQKFRYAWSLYALLGGSLVILMFSVIQLAFLNILPVNTIMPITLIMSAGLIIPPIIISFKIGQGGSRIKTTRSVSNAASNRDDDRYWKLGMFYYNPDDPAVFIEKRFGIGFTNNWARPLSWVFMIGLLALFAIIMAFSAGVGK